VWRAYYRLLEFFGPLARLIFYWHNKIFAVRRVRVAILRPNGDILLVQNSIGDKKWSLPGGGAGRKETDRAAACREVYEELHIRIAPSELKSLGVVTMNSYVAPLFAVRIDQARADTIVAHRVEIRSWRWVAPTNIPEGAQKSVAHVSSLLSTEVKVDRME